MDIKSAEANVSLAGAFEADLQAEPLREALRIIFSGPNHGGLITTLRHHDRVLAGITRHRGFILSQEFNLQDRLSTESMRIEVKALTFRLRDGRGDEFAPCHRQLVVTR